MKKVIKKTVEICDVCKKLESWYKCQKCGKAFCFDCKDGKLVEYSQGVYFSGRDGRYCNECDRKLQLNPTPAWMAYRLIAVLRAEHNAFEEQFKVKKETAEQHLNRIIGA